MLRAMIVLIARLLGLLYNHYNQSVRPLPDSENVHNSWITWYIFITFTFLCVSTFPNFWHVIPPIFDRYGFAEQLSSLACGCQLVKILISFDPYRLFRSIFAYLFILMLSIHPSMQNGGEGLRSIILAGQGHLVKMLIKVSKGAKIRNRYNQVPHLTQDTNGKVTNSQLDTTHESKEVSPFPAATRHI